MSAILRNSYDNYVLHFRRFLCTSYLALYSYTIIALSIDRHLLGSEEATITAT